MIRTTETLLEKGYAYEKLRSIYFDISRFSGYGKLSKIDLEKIRLGKTVDLDQYEKDNPRDFTLLKRSTLKELKKGVFYKTPWGNVRPGWHLECPVMAMKLLGETHDIHISDIGLVFPHHENAIAISEAVTDKPLANFWLHSELVMMNGKKAKSGEKVGNETIRDLMDKGYSGKEIRYWLLSRHYRKPMVFSWSKLETARNTVAHLDRFVQKLSYCRPGAPNPDMDQMVYDVKQKFMDSLDDDLNIAPALAALFEFTREINRVMDKDGLSPEDRGKVENVLKVINAVIGVMDLEPRERDEEIEAMVKERAQARKEKDWARADRIRDKLLDMGIEVVDAREGSIWRRVKDSTPR
jgi:cysteinyl-tRNA synthetase